MEVVRGVGVSVVDKLEIAHDLISGAHDVNALSEQARLSRSTIYKYGRQVRTEKVMKSLGGRPRIFDPQSMSVLREVIVDENQLTWDQILVIMYQEQVRTWCRWRRLVFEEVDPSRYPSPMSAKSVRRYLIKLGFYELDSLY